MATGPKLDGAGTAKMGALEDALGQLQTLHGVVERMALAVKQQQSLSFFGPMLRRVGQPLAATLKGHYGLLSDQVTAMLLAATRGNNAQLQVRALREGVAQLRSALEIQVTQVKAKHTVDDEKKAAAE